MPRAGSPYNYTYIQQRMALLAEPQVCQLCGKTPATSADHQPPLSRHLHIPGTGLLHTHPKLPALPTQARWAADAATRGRTQRLNTSALEAMVTTTYAVLHE